jgi:predicted TPR repeat methyltransferase
MVTESSNGSKFWLHPVAWGLMLTLLCGGPVHADEVADIYQRLQNSPQSVPLNLQYARAAEKAGKLKWALPAYERALSADPRNQEARTGIDRITSKLRVEADPS